jgi:hypothetical protein
MVLGCGWIMDICVLFHSFDDYIFINGAQIFFDNAYG